MIPILYEDDDIIVVHKPSNMPSQKDFSRSPDMLSAIENYLHTSAYLVHRLDRHVAGPVLVAKSKQAAARLNEQIRERTVKKTYLAIVVGQASKDEKVLVHYLKKQKGMAHVLSDKEYQEIKGLDKETYKKAVLSYHSLQEKVMEGHSLSMLEIHLETGRFHQIRSQLSKFGLPILGDPKYGTCVFENTKINKIGLQAIEIEYRHPRTGSLMSLKQFHKESPFDMFELDQLKTNS